MPPLDIIIAILMVVFLVWVDEHPLDRLVSALLLASVCVGQDLPVLRGSLAVIALVAWIARAVVSDRKISKRQPATPPAQGCPRTS